ncbi:hypothetical protein JW948_15980 [bacterium]|nr:hypothetical protein [bacterium]
MNQKGIIIYFTAYGTTKKYAEWISDEIDAEIRSYREVTDSELQASDFLIIGSFVMAHRLIISKWLAKKEPLLKNKKLFVYSVSGAKPGARELDNIFKVSLPESLLNNAQTYQFGGKMRYEDLSGFHKLMMKIGILIEKNPEAKAEMKNDIKIAKDNINREYIKPLIEDFNSYIRN